MYKSKQRTIQRQLLKSREDFSTPIYIFRGRSGAIVTATVDILAVHWQGPDNSEFEARILTMDVRWQSHGNDM